MAYIFRLANDENIDISDPKYIPSRRTSYTLPIGVYELSDINLILKSLLPKDVKIGITFDNIRIKSSLKNNQTLLIFTNNSFD